MIDRNAETPPSLANPDLVSELLMGMRLYGMSYHRTQITPPFGIRYGTIEGRAQFHFVGRGPVYLRGPDDTLHTLEIGDAVLLPRGGEHALLSEPDFQSQCITNFQARPLCRDVKEIIACSNEPDRQNDALIFSGCMEFDLGSMHPLVALMPDVMRVSTLLERYPEILPILDAMERETQGDRAGFAGILARLADVVSAFIVRSWVECGCGGSSGWVAALRDPRLGHVIAALHRDPGRDWTVAELARQMGSSRSVFAERFQTVTGMTPVRYLTELRMRLAAQWISREGLAIETAAHRLGYGSQAAFSRAFKRVIGKPPGAMRAATPAPMRPAPMDRADATPPA
ncbi:AraC family transcriptional regulator [Nitratireductor aquimarinus]|uniref:AraC family transcriptional regulator n=1 Tax=Nitratireductor aquimarinus TaxID=889300 RepID=UPI001A9063D0|nr:AraC family transcriptional regulator [Nitratireductor aquimarinus]MBN8242049.1 AraC family transcriptional regulator [Nitratireductor aquimarinus]MBY6130435.1 AraC family transcriptional regulator [Nitratireductor aquimarinus]MCA1302810.1 AraC family transcriptional regulator [Nitratireductor aquimarinus]